MSSKPFKPCSLDILIYVLAPHYYNAEELGMIESFEEQQRQLLHLQHEEEASTSKTKPKPEKEKEKKRRRELHDELTPSWVNKKSRNTKMNASPPTRSPPKPSMPTPSPPSPSPPSAPLPPPSASLPPQLPASSPPRSPPPPAPVLPDEFKNRIRELNGSDVQFVMSKNLSKTDLSANHNRLSMPMKEICCDFLTEGEKATLHERESSKGRLRGVEVKVLDPSLREYTLILKRWEMTSTSIYCLIKEWKSVVSRNSLQEGDQLQIWSSRVNGKLFLLLNKL